MADFNEGYRSGKRMEAEMNGMARGGKVRIAAKSLTRPRIPSPKAPAVSLSPPPINASAPIGASPPQIGMGQPPQFKAGGKIKVKAHVRAYAKGGSVKVKGMKDGGKWIQGAIGKPGALHEQLGVPKGEKIPAKKLSAAASKGGVLGKRARLAETLKSFHHKDGGKVKKMAKGGPVEGSAKDTTEDKVQAKKAGMSMKKWEASAMDAKHDKKMRGGGKVKSGKEC